MFFIFWFFNERSFDISFFILNASSFSLSVIIPQSLDIDNAVFILSPVIILIVIPAFLHFFILSGTSSLIGSLIPIINSNVKLFKNSWKNNKFFSLYINSFDINSSEVIFFDANIIVLFESFVYSSILFDIICSFLSKFSTSFFIFLTSIMKSFIISYAPLT